MWHHFHHVFGNFWMRQSKPSLFFRRVNNFSIVTTVACCPFYSARATFATADGKVAKSARCSPVGPSRCFATCSWYQGRFTLTLCHFCAIVLPTRLSARCLQSSRLDTASIRSCLLLPPGFLDTREAWHLRRKSPSRNVSSSVAEI